MSSTEAELLSIWEKVRSRDTESRWSSILITDRVILEKILEKEDIATIVGLVLFLSGPSRHALRLNPRWSVASALRHRLLNPFVRVAKQKTKQLDVIQSGLAAANFLYIGAESNFTFKLLREPNWEVFNSVIPLPLARTISSVVVVSDKESLPLQTRKVA